MRKDTPLVPPINLATMRENSVRSISVSCVDCLHATDISVDMFPGHIEVPSFAYRMRCGRCGSKRVNVRPAWHTRPERATILSSQPVQGSNVIKFPGLKSPR